MLQQLGIAARCKQQWVTDEELAVLYHRALCFVYPSEYEGFGLPILEAYACGAPVICAQASCFPEIAANAAAYFSPFDAGELATKMEDIICSANTRNAMREAGRLRLADFSWNKTAEKTLETYLKVLGR